MRYFDENGLPVLDKSDYGYKSGSELKRAAIDRFCAQHCSLTEAKQYSFKKTKMHCIYCGTALFETLNGVKMIIKDQVAHDHIYPSARYGILCKGNSCVCCSKCNHEKSDKDAVVYFEERLNKGLPTMFATVEEFKEFLEDFIKPYKEDWPEYYKLATEGDSTRDEAQILSHYFMVDSVTGESLIDLSPKSGSQRDTDDLNNFIWEQLDDFDSPVYKKYSYYSAKDVKDRVTYAQKIYLDIQPQKLITKITKKEFLDFGNELILSKVNTKREIEKLRRLLNVLVNMPELKKFKTLEKHFYKSKEAEREAARREALKEEETNSQFI